jgi:putative DNA primase/helicase
MDKSIKEIQYYLDTPIIPLRKLWGSWLQEKSLTMIYAPRGIGKSYLVQRLAFSLQGGSEFLKFKCEPCRVAIVDGELTFEDLQERFNQIVKEVGRSARTDRIKVLSRRELGYDWNLGVREDQVHLWKLLNDCDVIILDNLMTLAPLIDGRDSDLSQWQRIQKFLIALRDSGKSVIVVHHAGKSGEQHGTSQRENIMDTILALYQLPPSDLGFIFELRFTKTRRFFGKDAEPLCLKMETSSDDVTRWKWEPMIQYKKDRIKSLTANGLTKKQIQEDLSLGIGEFARLLKEIDSENFTSVEDINDPF